MPCSLPGLVPKGGHLHRVVPTMSAGLWDCTFDQVGVRKAGLDRLAKCTVRLGLRTRTVREQIASSSRTIQPRIMVTHLTAHWSSSCARLSLTTTCVAQVYQYNLYANFLPTVLCLANPEIPDDDS